jgi:hypothetical protein
MSSLPRPPAPQDLPPKGGYPAIRYARNIPHRKVSAAAVGVGFLFITFYGMIELAEVWRERRFVHQRCEFHLIFFLLLW